MTVYPTFPNSARSVWQAPIEPIWQQLPFNEGHHPGWKRPDLGLSDRLFIGGVMNLTQGKARMGHDPMAGRRLSNQPSDLVCHRGSNQGGSASAAGPPGRS